MTKLTLRAPDPGLNKVRLTKLLQAELGMSLSAAKRATDQVADGQPVDVVAPDLTTAERTARAVRDVGGTAVVEELATARPLAG